MTSDVDIIIMLFNSELMSSSRLYESSQHDYIHETRRSVSDCNLKLSHHHFCENSVLLSEKL